MSILLAVLIVQNVEVLVVVVRGFSRLSKLVRPLLFNGWQVIVTFVKVFRTGFLVVVQLGDVSCGGAIACDHGQVYILRLLFR